MAAASIGVAALFKEGRMRMKKRSILAMTLVIAMLIALTGCTIGGKKPVQTDELDEATRELRQNDYRGGIVRLTTIRDMALDTIKDMKANNDTVRSDIPNGYWTQDGFQDFVTTFLESQLIEDTCAFNEEESDWSYVLSYLVSNKNSFTKKNSDGAYVAKYQDMEVTRNEKDDYSITGITAKYEGVSGTADYRILYDCDKDWVKCVVTLTPSNEYPTVTINLLEYGRINDNSFAIQTNKERFLVIFEDAKEDTDLRERKIKEFYYTKLSGGQRTSFNPVEYLPEYDENGELNANNIEKNNFMSLYSAFMNDKGDLATAYGYTDSIFLAKADLSDITANWVLEDKALSQAVIYKDNNLVVVTYNKLTQGYERFIYVRGTANEQSIDAICDMIDISGLEGLNEDVDNSYKQPEIPKTDDNSDDDSHNPYDPDSEDYGDTTGDITPTPIESKENE